MNYRNALLLAPEDLGPSGTKVIDLDLSQPVSRLTIRFRTTKVLYNMTAAGPANISKIELVDGSDVYHSLSGYENQALAYYSRPGVSMEHGQHIQTQSEVDIYTIDFGRYLWDRELAFLPAKYRNPQLRITFDEDVADTSVTANECEVWAHIFDELGVTPIGFLSAREWHAYTCGAENSYETVVLPEDKVIRQMLVRAFRDGFEPLTTIDEARLDENNLQRIAWEYTDLEDYYRWQKSVEPSIKTPLVIEPTNAQRYFYVPQTDYWARIQGLNVADGQEVYVAGTDMKGGKADVRGTANAQWIGTAEGWLPWHCYRFGLGLQPQIDDWYNPAGRKPRLRLRAGSNGTNGTGQVVLEQLHRY